MVDDSKKCGFSKFQNAKVRCFVIWVFYTMFSETHLKHTLNHGSVENISCSVLNCVGRHLGGIHLPRSPCVFARGSRGWWLPTDVPGRK